MTPKNILPRTKIADFIDNLYDGDLHAKRVLSLANATLGVLVSASLAVHAIGQGLAQALGKLSKHGVKQVDRLLSNQGVDVELIRIRGHLTLWGGGIHHAEIKTAVRAGVPAPDG